MEHKIKLIDDTYTTLDKVEILSTNVLVRFRHDKYDDALLSSAIKCNDGSIVRLSIVDDCDDILDRRSVVFRQVADVLKVGEQVTGIEVGDIAIMDYKVDNNAYIIVGEDELGKLCVINGVSLYEKEDDIMLPLETADFYGYIRNGQFFAKEPFVLVEYQPDEELKVSPSGIFYSVKEPVKEYKIIAASDVSKEKFFLLEGAMAQINDQEVYEIDFKNGEKIMYCYDMSIKISAESFKDKKLEDIVNLIKN